MSRSRSNEQRIPLVRRHIYFYLLLFLGTVAMRGLWMSPQAPVASPEVDQAYALIAKANQSN